MRVSTLSQFLFLISSKLSINPLVHLPSIPFLCAVNVQLRRSAEVSGIVSERAHGAGIRSSEPNQSSTQSPLSLVKVYSSHVSRMSARHVHNDLFVFSAGHKILPEPVVVNFGKEQKE